MLASGGHSVWFLFFAMAIRYAPWYPGAILTLISIYITVRRGFLKGALCVVASAVCWFIGGFIYYTYWENWLRL
jgi:hypothetical protein